MGPIAVELCCLFDLISRAPLRFVCAKVCTSEHKLITKLIKHLKKNDLLLIDSGFYNCSVFEKITARRAHFIIPSTANHRPRVIEKLAESDYLCEIKESKAKLSLRVRVVYVYRDGFRRRRLVTSLLDHLSFPASELGSLYHMRWDIETFYRDFKRTLRGTCWHCRTPINFHKELLVHMIALCTIRLAMLEAARIKNVGIARLSFARALTETRLFLKRLVQTDPVLWPSIWEAFVQCCARHLVYSKPDRRFPRDQQEYRRKNRGVRKRRSPGYKPKRTAAIPPRQQPETRNDTKGQAFLLS